jgi:hypothetical protein
MTTTTTTHHTFASRAVQRRVEAGSSVICAGCDEQVKFAAKMNRQQVIANVYLDGRWDRVEHYHAECYVQAGNPYGVAVETPLKSARTRSA